MVLVSEDIGENRVAVIGVNLVGDKSHGHAGHRLLDLHACVHEGEAASADGSHGRRAVGFEDI